MPDWISALASIVTAFAAVGAAVGVIAAFRQVKASSEATRAQLLLHFNAEWRSVELYRGVSYIHEIRKSWILRTGDAADLAREWVESYAPESVVDGGRAVPSEWLLRRNVAQYLRHAGYLLHRNYLSADDIFSTNPEVGRLLEVIIPLENAIIDHYVSASAPTAAWDMTAKKWELDELVRAYEVWFTLHRDRSFGKHLHVPTRRF